MVNMGGKTRKVARTHTYKIHDNGSVPFKVTVQGKKFRYSKTWIRKNKLMESG